MLLPALDEEAAIGKVLSSIPVDRLWGLGFQTKVLVVDGQSADRTREIAKNLGAQVMVQNGLGKGGALRHGFEASAADMVVILDADGSYPPEKIPEFVEMLSNGADVVIGSRLRGEILAGAMTPLNLVGNRILSVLASLLYQMPVSDICSGMWGIHARALRRMNLSSQRFDIEAEVFAEARRLGLRVHEIPIRYSRRIGTSKLIPLTAGIEIFGRLLTMRLAQSQKPGATAQDSA